MIPILVGFLGHATLAANKSHVKKLKKLKNANDVI